jgi:hypothetical protein
MPDVMECINKCMTETGGPVPIPPRPASFSLTPIFAAAVDVVQDDPALRAWMRSVGLDPDEEQDSLVAVGLVVGISKPQAMPA